jgi:hypothetical protein
MKIGAWPLVGRKEGIEESRARKEDSCRENRRTFSAGDAAIGGFEAG